jgi:hypothetical protein
MQGNDLECFPSKELRNYRKLTGRNADARL